MAQSAERRDRRMLVAIFFAALALCALVTKSHVVSWNDGSRIATVDALTADHTFQIDGSPFAAGLGDMIRFRGRSYSDKPPLPAVLGAGVAMLLAPFGISLRHTPAPAIYLVTLLTVGVAFAIGCCYAYGFARLLGYDSRIAVAVATLTGAGTLTLPYAAVLTNHVPCGAAGLAACYHLYRAREDGLRDVAAGGFAVSLCYAFDAAGGVFVLAAAMLLWGQPLGRWLLCAAAGAPMVAAQLGYNVAISGSVLPTVFNLSVWSDPTLPLHAESAKVLVVHSAAEYLAFIASLLVGVRGLFAFTPLMLVTAYGLAVMWRTGGRERRLALALGAVTVVYFFMIVFLQQNDVRAVNFGQRRYVDLFFALSVALGPALGTVRTPPAAMGIRLAVVASVAIAALGTLAPFGGAPGESGFVFGAREYAALFARTPVQATLDALLLIVLLALVLRVVERALAARLVTPAVRPRE